MGGIFPGLAALLAPGRGLTGGSSSSRDGRDDGPEVWIDCAANPLAIMDPGLKDKAVVEVVTIDLSSRWTWKVL